MHWITLDPGNVFIQVLEPINIVDVVIGRDETARLLSWVIRFFGSQDPDLFRSFHVIRGRLLQAEQRITSLGFP